MTEVLYWSIVVGAGTVLLITLGGIVGQALARERERISVSLGRVP
jgi:hypothetical protein